MSVVVGCYVKSSLFSAPVMHLRHFRHDDVTVTSKKAVSTDDLSVCLSLIIVASQ